MIIIDIFFLSLVKIAVNSHYATFTVLGEFMEVNPSSSSVGSNLFNLNISEQPVNEMQVKHESAISSLELKVNSEDLVQNLGELSQNLSQSLNIADYPPNSANMTDSLSRIVNETADECCK